MERDQGVGGPVRRRVERRSLREGRDAGLLQGAFRSIRGQTPPHRFFEEPVKLLEAKRGFMDLFWKGVLLGEQKSAGRRLAPGKVEALDYFPALREAEHRRPHFAGS